MESVLDGKEDTFMSVPFMFYLNMVSQMCTLIELLCTLIAHKCECVCCSLYYAQLIMLIPQTCEPAWFEAFEFLRFLLKTEQGYECLLPVCFYIFSCCPTCRPHNVQSKRWCSLLKWLVTLYGMPRYQMLFYQRLMLYSNKAIQTSNIMVWF